MNNLIEAQTRRILHQAGALVVGHSKDPNSRRHLDDEVELAAVLPDHQSVAHLCADIVMHFYDVRGIGVEYDAVVGVGLGGAVLASWAAYNSTHLWIRGKDFPGLWAECASDGTDYFIGAMGRMLQGQKVLIITGLFDSAPRISRLIEVIRGFEGEVLGVGSILRYSDVSDAGFGAIEVFSLLTLDTWAPDQCPTCIAQNSKQR